MDIFFQVITYSFVKYEYMIMFIILQYLKLHLIRSQHGDSWHMESIVLFIVLLC
jgi:hypothetical protein